MLNAGDHEHMRAAFVDALDAVGAAYDVVDTMDGVRAVVITGPNTGGKTVCLKTLGMAALMAKAGLRVLGSPRPPSSREIARGDGGDRAEVPDCVEIPYFEAVLADIGDDQSIAQAPDALDPALAPALALALTLTLTLTPTPTPTLASR